METGLAFYRDRFSNFSDYTFYIVGAFDEALIRPLVEQYLATLPVLDRKETWVDSGIRPPGGIQERTVRAGVEPRSQVAIVFFW